MATIHVRYTAPRYNNVVVIESGTVAEIEEADFLPHLMEKVGSANPPPVPPEAPFANSTVVRGRARPKRIGADTTDSPFAPVAEANDDVL